MTITALTLAAKVIADTSEAEKNLKTVQKTADDASGQQSGGGLKGVLSSALSIAGGIGIVAGLGSAVGVMSGFLADSVTVAKEAQQSQALLSNAIKDTHNASGQSVQGLQDMAEHLSQVTAFSKETVEGVEQIVVRAKIPKGMFNETTQEALDLSTALGISAPDAANILTKALDNPKNAAAALRREHINLTDAQQKAIAWDVKHGDSLAAQKVILDAVKGSYGGAAQAAGDTFAGAQARLQNALENTKEKVGSAVLPILSKMMDAVLPLVTQFADKFPGALKIATDWLNRNAMPAIKGLASIITDQVIPAVVNISGKVGDFIGYLQTHQDAMDAFKAILAGIAVAILAALVPSFVAWAISAGAAAIATIAATAPVILIGLAIGLLILGIYELITHWKQVTDLLGKFKDGVAKDVGAAWNGLVGIVQNVWKGIQGAVKGGVNLVIADINGFINLLDKIQIHIPPINVGPVHIPGFDWNGPGIRDIPYLAEGGTATRGGMALVGERGPELLNLPTGASVVPLPAGMSSAGASAASGTLNGQPIVVNLYLNNTLFGQAVAKALPAAIRNATGARSF